MRPAARLLCALCACAMSAPVPASAKEPAASAPDGGAAKDAAAPPGGAASGAAPKGEVVDINTASEAALRKLEGISKERADAIIGNRPYASTEDLVTGKVLPRAVFERIKAQLGVGPRR